VVMLALGVCEFRWLLLLKNVSFRKMTCRKNKKRKKKLKKKRTLRIFFNANSKKNAENHIL